LHANPFAHPDLLELFTQLFLKYPQEVTFSPLQAQSQSLDQAIIPWKHGPEVLTRLFQAYRFSNLNIWQKHGLYPFFQPVD
ncbi:hypothetical protein Q0O86_14200, partial [Staphylococcus aureus]|nr:hypothetical protein [Staphylococcus aureus]